LSTVAEKISPSATNEIGLYGRLSKTAAATTKTMIARTKRISSFFFIPDTSKCQSAKNSNIICVKDAKIK
jgi:hypothetical protein